MDSKKRKRNIVLGILFLLPVLFLLMLLPASHNYNPLDVVNSNVLELPNFTLESSAVPEKPKDTIQLKNSITILGFLGKQPLNHRIGALNLKELVYDNFRGFKRFQIVMMAPKGVESDVAKLKKEVSNYDELKYWHFIFAEDHEIQNIFKSLKSKKPLDNNLFIDDVFIIDKELNQRGRIDDRTEREVEKNSEIYDLSAYNCIDINVIKNKMSDDLRVLFTEYRQKRKGKFDSSSRRADDLKQNNEQ